jgi:hypothetical protein
MVDRLDFAGLLLPGGIESVELRVPGPPLALARLPRFEQRVADTVAHGPEVGRHGREVACERLEKLRERRRSGRVAAGVQEVVHLPVEESHERGAPARFFQRLALWLPKERVEIRSRRSWPELLDLLEQPTQGRGGRLGAHRIRSRSRKGAFFSNGWQKSSCPSVVLSDNLRTPCAICRSVASSRYRSASTASCSSCSGL